MQRIALTDANTLPAIFGFEEELALHYRRIMASTNGSLELLEQIESPRLGQVLKALYKSQYPEPRLHCTSDSAFTKFGYIYADQGKNYEFASHECMSPFEVAGLLQLHRGRLQNYLSAFDNVYCSVVSSSERNTLGFHENYFSTINHKDFFKDGPQALTAHMITRVLFTGSGGHMHTGHFSISPRLTWMHSVEPRGDSYSTPNRSVFLKRDEPHSDMGMRIQIVSADHPYNPQTAALIFGTTALAIRLYETGRLPVAKRDWARDCTKLCLAPCNNDFELMREALAYQRSLYEASKEYIEETREKDLLEFFGTVQDTDKFMNLWLDRIVRLEKYLSTGNLEKLGTEIEWSVLFGIHKQNLSRNGRDDLAGFVDPKVKRKFLELGSLTPRSEKARAHTKVLMAGESYLDDAYAELVPRARFRSELLDRMPTLPKNSRIEMNWGFASCHIGLKKVSIGMPTPFSGVDESLDACLQMIETPFNKECELAMDPRFECAFPELYLHMALDR